MNKYINITTPSYFPAVDGTSFVVQENVRCLLDLGFKVNVFSINGSKSKYGENVYSFNISGNGRIFNSFSGEISEYQNKIFEYSHGSSLNIYHGWHCWTTNLALDLKLKCTSQIVYSHGTGFSTLEPYLKRLARKLLYLGQKSKLLDYYSLIDGIIFISNDIAHPRCFDLISFPKKSFYISNPCLERQGGLTKIDNEVIFKFKLLINSKKRIFLNISNYQSVKNQMFLIKLINSYHEDVHMIFVGSIKNNYLDRLIQYNNSFSNKYRISFFYGLSDLCIQYLYMNSSCFLFASKNDFVPLVLIECNKYSLPFISFRTADSCREGGFFVENETDYLLKFDFVCNLSIDQLNILGKKGLGYYETNNSFEVYKHKIFEVLNFFSK